MVSYTTMVALPLGAWFLWDTAEYYLPKSINIPLVSYFRREWARDPASQAVHMKLLGDIALFAVIVYQFYEAAEENSIRSASQEEREAIEKGIETMAQSDYESHAKCMETLMVKHKVSSF
eukprot:TRINITY_DN61607_c0_g1_i1.p1 TRINITY_DN61607_c0_g1~~TRINITY_DN61607_c0_g1_i1.p1  ORF type:complete len:138 (+),score=48.29 TRINITY_DN61607_c0_g1_i1:55-414(+)